MLVALHDGNRIEASGIETVDTKYTCSKGRAKKASELLISTWFFDNRSEFLFRRAS